MGGQASKLREDLESTQRQLTEEKTRADGLQAGIAELRGQLSAKEGTLLQRERELATSARECARRLDAKEEERIKAIKQREVCEELRRSDALLVKSITTAMLARPKLDAALPDTAAAARASFAAEGETQLRTALNQTVARLGAAEASRAALLHATRSAQRSELCQTLWLLNQCDASLTLRSSNLMVLGGLRMPRPHTDGQSASGLSGGVGVLRRFGAESGTAGRWAALGGSLLWDARERELAALRFAVCAEPASNQRVCVGVDHTGSLTGSLKSHWDVYTLNATGAFDLNRRGGNRVGIELSYDLD